MINNIQTQAFFGERLFIIFLLYVSLKIYKLFF